MYTMNRRLVLYNKYTASNIIFDCTASLYTAIIIVHNELSQMQMGDRIEQIDNPSGTDS